MPNKDERPAIDLNKVAEFREQLAKEVEKQSDLYYIKDLERIKADDWYCQRFLLQQKNNVERAVSMAKDALEWRNTFKVQDISKETLASESFTEGTAFPYNTDKEGSSILMLKVRLHKKPSGDAAKEAKRYLVYWMERLQRENNGGKITVVFDCANSGMGNLDLDQVRFIVNLFKYYYPHSLGYILVYEMPWLFNAAWKVIKTWLPKDAVDRIKFINKSNVKEYVDENCLPVDMGGNDTHTFVYEEEKVGNAGL